LVYLACFFNYFGGGPDFGGRYWFLMIVPGAALTATALRRLGRAPLSSDVGAASLGEPRALAFATAATLGALLVFVPWRCLDKYHDFRGMRPGVADLAGPQGYGRALVLVRGKEVPDWGSAAVENPLDVTTGETVYAWDRSQALRRELVAAYQDRRFYLVDGPSRTGGEFRLRAGPLSAAELLARPFEP
jgi:hypothetical protein